MHTCLLAVAPAVKDYKCLLEALFVPCWDVYLAQTPEIARQLEVKNFVAEHLREDATSDVARCCNGTARNCHQLPKAW
jgi:hypothetical protein